MSLNHLSIVVGSKNPVKVNAAKAAFQLYFPQHEISVASVNAPSSVAEQPMTEAETLLGAKNRVLHCQQEFDDSADFYIAIEGGVDHYHYGPAAFAYVVISSANTNQETIGLSAQLPLPEGVYQALQQGEELGDVIDKLFNTHNAKQKSGAMGLFTNGLVTRQSTYQQALILALAKIANANLYQ
ncbi:non-canonical purine NTP phosphatase [Thalassotalea euphylliae]|uniref:Inosine/xanthosine triphosphatase n=1 Tax=Thalassotalea euphylliae TaxID=1655234 RepID=A0A3E0TQC0_9GAMM|nr:inosine/xanthosine triphosphatase [Thalassotalea euphylliae]REL26841.1 non-canonical purine NTP phosphatase [Thalassotalea euphylliae]